MRIQTIIRLIAAVLVLSLLAATVYVLLDYFGWSENSSTDRNSSRLKNKQSLTLNDGDELVVIDSLRRKLLSGDAPEIVLGNPAFEKARAMLLRGDYDDARLHLEAIVVRFPGTPAEREAYRILGEMRMDDLLQQRPDDGKILYTVKPGDSYLKIVREHDMNLDLLNYLNRLTRVDRLQVDDKLILMPLNLSLKIMPRLNQLFLVNEDGTVIKRYEPLLDMTIPKLRSGSADKKRTTIESIQARQGRSQVNMLNDAYRASNKRIMIADPRISIVSEEAKLDESFRGIILRKEDLEELVMLLRRSNLVEILY